MSGMGLRKVWALLLLGFWLSACASGEAVSPLERAVGVGQEMVEGGRVQGQAEADLAEGIFLRVRHNPARCDVPALEIYTHGQWIRAYFDGSQEVIARLQVFEGSAPVLSRTSYVEVSGKFSGRRRTEAGVRYPVFAISDLREAAVTDGGPRADAEPFERFDQPRACL